MKYYLMHKDYKAAVLEINVEYGAIEKISTLQKELLPLCAQSKVLNDPREIKRWWSDRAVSKNQSNVKKLLEVLNRLVDQGNSVILIEHNLDVIKSSDYLIDLGPEGGDEGGRIVAAGTPEEVSDVEESYTGQFLRRYLGRE